MIYLVQKKMLLIRLFSFLLIVSSTQAQNLSELYEDFSSSVVVLQVVNVAPEVVGNNIDLTEQGSQGSGVLISDDGLIWTAAHVVQAAEKVKVEFLDGDVYDADVLNLNKQADVALVKIRGDFQLKDKKIAKIGDSDKTKIGADVFVLGAPHGFKQSLSRGILSGRYTPEHLSNDFISIEFLQTDAAINPGNSGGPMFNMQGEVIGIASRIYTQSGGFEGIGFAMSSNVAKKLLMESAGIWLGMESTIVRGAIARALNFPNESGLLITSLSSKGAAAELGLRGGYISANIDGVDIILGGDVILEIDGISIKDNNSLFQIRNRLGTAKKGEKITMSVLRNGMIGRIEFSK